VFPIASLHAWRPGLIFFPPLSNSGFMVGFFPAATLLFSLVGSFPFPPFGSAFGHFVTFSGPCARIFLSPPTFSPPKLRNFLRFMRSLLYCRTMTFLIWLKFVGPVPLHPLEAQPPAIDLFVPLDSLTKPGPRAGFWEFRFHTGFFPPPSCIYVPPDVPYFAPANHFFLLKAVASCFLPTIGHGCLSTPLGRNGVGRSFYHNQKKPLRRPFPGLCLQVTKLFATFLSAFFFFSWFATTGPDPPSLSLLYYPPPSFCRPCGNPFARQTFPSSYLGISMPLPLFCREFFCFFRRIFICPPASARSPPLNPLIWLTSLFHRLRFLQRFLFFLIC